MVVDTSAIVAILAESDGELYLNAASTSGPVVLSAVSLYEARVVLGGRRQGRPRFPPQFMDDLDDLLATLRADVVAFDRRQARLAHEAYQRYGKGFHPAGLNLGDCAAYALATSRGEPLLFKGDDFARTDVTPAV